MKLCGFDVGLDKPFFLMAGPCVIESEEMVMEIAREMKAICDDLGIPYIFKASYDKANRTSVSSFRGPGIEKGLEILARVRETVGVPVVTDVHTEAEVPLVAKYVDVLQTPAFLCRQTDFICACARTGKPVNIKKGQFLAPHDMINVIEKARAAAREAGVNEDNFMCCERGASLLCAKQARRLFLTQRIRCSCRVATARVQAATALSCRCFRAPRSPLVFPAFSWRRTLIRNAPRAMARIWSRFHVCVNF